MGTGYLFSTLTLDTHRNRISQEAQGEEDGEEEGKDEKSSSSSHSP
jgi:hypothetical protein